MSDFDNILDRAGTEVSDEAVLYPQGTYLLRCASVAFGSFTSKDGEEIPTASLSFAVGHPTDDVDMDEFREVEEEVRGQRVWKRFTLDNSQNKAAFKRAIRTFGINPDDVENYPTLRDAAKACKNGEVMGFIGVNSYTSKKTNELVRQNEVKSLSPANDFSDAA